MSLILHFAQCPINFTNTVICPQDNYFLTFTICLQYFALSLCYWCPLLSLLSSILICKNYIKLIIYGYLGSKDAGLWILMYSSHEQSAIWRELRIDESISGWLYPSYGLFIKIHQWTWLFLLQVLAFKPALKCPLAFFCTYSISVDSGDTVLIRTIRTVGVATIYIVLSG